MSGMEPLPKVSQFREEFQHSPSSFSGFDIGIGNTPTSLGMAFSPGAHSTNSLSKPHLTPDRTGIDVKNNRIFSPMGAGAISGYRTTGVPVRDPFRAPVLPSKVTAQQQLSATANAFRPLYERVLAELEEKEPENGPSLAELNISPALGTELFLSRCVEMSAPMAVTTDDIEFFMTKLASLGSPCQGMYQAVIRNDKAYVRFTNMRDSCVAHRNVQLCGPQWQAKFMSPPEFCLMVAPGENIATMYEGQLDILAVILHNSPISVAQIEPFVCKLLRAEGDVFAFKKHPRNDEGSLKAIVEYADINVAIRVASKLNGMTSDGLHLRIEFYNPAIHANRSFSVNEGMTTPLPTPLRYKLDEIKAFEKMQQSMGNGSYANNNSMAGALPHSFNNSVMNSFLPTRPPSTSLGTSTRFPPGLGPPGLGTPGLYPPSLYPPGLAVSGLGGSGLSGPGISDSSFDGSGLAGGPGINGSVGRLGSSSLSGPGNGSSGNNGAGHSGSSDGSGLNLSGLGGSGIGGSGAGSGSGSGPGSGNTGPQVALVPMVLRNTYTPGTPLVLDPYGTTGNTMTQLPGSTPIVFPPGASMSSILGGHGFDRNMGARRGALRLDRSMSYSQNGHHNQVDVNRIREGVDVRTTIMLRNIPNKVDQRMLKAIVDESSWGKYDFMYLRIDFANDCNVGYAFINFADPLDIIDFARARDNQRWNCFRSDKIAEISYATIQGRDCLIQKFRNSSVMLEATHYRPKLYYTVNGMNPEAAGHEEDFPGPDNPSKMKRSCENAEHVGLFTPHLSQFYRDEQRRRRSQYDRGTRMAALEEYDYETVRQMYLPH